MALQLAAVRQKLAALPVVKSGLSLMTGTVVTSGLGLVFWVVAANLYDRGDFGVATTAVYTMMMLADVACLGLRSGLVRYVPIAGAATSRTITWGYGLVFIASSLTAIVFLLGLELWADSLVELRSTVLLFFVFVLSTAFWAIFTLEDAVLVGLRRSPWVPIENSIFGILKIVLLFPFAAISPTLGIFWAWTLPVFPIVFGVNALIARESRAVSRAAKADKPPSASLLRNILEFSLADWFASVGRLAALVIIPLMVIDIEGDVEAGYFQASWLIAFTIFTLSSNAAYALLAETSYEEDSLNRNSVQAGALSLGLTVPIIAVGVIGAPWLLLIYGSDFADNSSAVLRILLLAAIPNVIYQIYIGRLRSQNRMAAVVVLESLLSVIVIGLTWLWLPRFGIVAVGFAWAVGLVVLATYAAVQETLWWWASRVDTRMVRTVGRGFHLLRHGRPARGMPSRLGGVLDAVKVEDAPVTWLAKGDHGQTAVVDVDGDRRLVVDFARSPSGADELANGQRVVEDLLADTRLVDLHPLLPTVEARGMTEEQEFTAWALGVAPTALERIGDGLSTDRACQLILGALEPLHAVTARTMTIDEADLRRWIDQPLGHLVTEGRASSSNLVLLRSLLGDGLIGATVDVGQIHGELALDNVVMAEGERVTGLLRWERSTEAPLFIDNASLALSDLASGDQRELGDVVRSLLLDVDRFAGHPAMRPVRDPVSPQSILLLTWLNLVGRPLPPRRAMSSEVFWLARNARPVLASLEPLAEVAR